MSIYSAKTAIEYAKKALSLAWDGKLPVDPEVIARGLVVYKTDPHTGQKNTYPIKVCGKSTHALNGASGQAYLAVSEPHPYYLCEYNQDEISYRKRFTVAHELGHVLLDHVNSENTRMRDSNFSNNYDPYEVAANTFAAELVMPEKEVRELFSVAANIQQLAEAFGVSNAAITYRIKNLGLI